MIRRFIIGALLATGLMSLSVNAFASDYVTKVYLCGPNTILIYLQSGTVLDVNYLDSAHMTNGLFNQIYAMSLQLLSSGRQVTYYNNLASVNTCGVTGAIEINALQASNIP